MIIADTGFWVALFFSKLGILSYAPSVDEDVLMEAALDAGAEDVITHDGAVDVMTTPKTYLPSRQK